MEGNSWRIKTAFLQKNALNSHMLINDFGQYQNNSDHALL